MKKRDEQLESFQKSVKFINKSGALALVIFKMIIVPLFVYECFLSTIDLWKKDHEPGYCRLNGAFWHFVLSHFFILGYHILLIYQTILLSRMTRNFDFVDQRTDESQVPVETVLSTQTGETRIESEYGETVYIHPRVSIHI
uniref:G_PROTEIN_RECEP_F1_2 domain-containing protein n=1 Tax=Caenorhabditis tropicalis TaxID=1561998 RepID=A0A1I7TTC1_9PELO